VDLPVSGRKSARAAALRDRAAYLWIPQEIGLQALLSHEDYAVSPARQLLFFHPRNVVRILTLTELLCSRCL
jgi:hypothetical protein